MIHDMICDSIQIMGMNDLRYDSDFENYGHNHNIGG